MRETLRFLLGEERVELTSCDPTLTLLDWLRLDKRMTGSKEGCAEGDCGACTVVVGRLDRGCLRYEAINACIRFLPTLDGCHVLTVEHLKGPDGALHPVQQAIVDHHGSQCGFCTPGIVMSLLALWLNETAPTVARIEDALAGNLCRCTGYEPIVKAARSLTADRSTDRFVRARAEIKDRLSALQDEESLSIGANGRRFFAPATVETLAALRSAHPDATLVAGATDVGLWITKGMQQPGTVIHLGRIEALRAIEDAGDHLRIGAMATHADVRTALAALSPQLGELMRRFGGEQVRNAGTIGGNIANGSPIGDLPPALIALGARLVLASRHCEERSDEAAHGGAELDPPGLLRSARNDGEALALDSRSIALEDFFIDYRRQDLRPGEFVLDIIVPKLPPEALFHVSKISKRFDEDISAVCAAFFIARDAAGYVTQARLAFGGMAGTPKRARAAEAALTGRLWSKAAVEDAAAALAADYTPLSDMRASAGYRLTVAGNLLRRFWLETEHPHVQTRVAGPLAEAAHG